MRHILWASCLAVMAGPALADTTLIADLRYGSTATISGTVERITDEDEFRITDASGSVTVYIGPGVVPFDIGEQITVNGIVDREFGRMEIYAREAVRADGSKLSFTHQYE
ncbi:MAG: hypothetical protein C0427_07515 [Rhodobacter sp.]|nr:hypothetical protein [Rhodobacter sp.]